MVFRKSKIGPWEAPKESSLRTTIPDSLRIRIPFMTRAEKYQTHFSISLASIFPLQEQVSQQQSIACILTVRMQISLSIICLVLTSAWSLHVGSAVMALNLPRQLARLSLIWHC